MKIRSNIKTVIIDDEMKARELLKRLIDKYCPEIEIIGEANCIESGYKVILEKNPDLVFLDIYLDQQNSFDLLSKIENPTFEIIFTSGHSNYGVSAFKVNAIDYILKPIDSDDLILALEKVVKKRELEAKVVHEIISIPVHANDSVEYINSNQITSLVADDNYTQLFTIENKKYIVTKTLSEIESLLKETNHFLRIHRSICINTKHISSYSKSDPCEITMTNGLLYEISRRKKAEVLALLKGLKIIPI